MRAIEPRAWDSELRIGEEHTLAASSERQTEEPKIRGRNDLTIGWGVVIILPSIRGLVV